MMSVLFRNKTYTFNNICGNGTLGDLKKKLAWMNLEKSKYAYNSKTIIKPSPYALTPSFISKHFCHTLLNNDCMMCVGGNLLKNNSLNSRIFTDIFKPDEYPK